MYQQLINYWDRTTFSLTNRFYYTCFGIISLFIISYFLPPVFLVAVMMVVVLILLVLADTLLLYQKKEAFLAGRLVPDRLSIGDPNIILLTVKNLYHFKVEATIIDELPYQFQDRNWRRVLTMEPAASEEINYTLTPKERGVYSFGSINVFIKSGLAFISRRIIFERKQEVKVYPSFIQMRRYQLLATASMQHSGVRQTRRLGHSMEFEQIKEYVRGEDYRTVNWKATARKGELMVNTFTDERSQQIYCLVNKGRVMKMPFNGMTLLDYAINASLVISNTALLKQDKAGLITFSQNVDAFLPADKKPAQISHMLETLYRQETNFMEPDFEKLFSVIRNRITQRSLLVLFTNFESIESLQRELAFLKRLAHYHLLMVVFFENTELKQLIETKTKSTEDIYIKTIAEKYRYEKHLITKELQKHGIVALLTTPEKLTINALNKYLELKNRQSI